MMQKGSSPNGHFHPISFDSLRLGSSVDDDATYQTNVMFTDPCSLCGNKKRRILTPQESRKKISIDPNSINSNSPTPTPTPTPTQTPTPMPSFSPSLHAVPANTNNNVNAQPAFSIATPESKNNGNTNLGISGRSSSPATVPLPPRPPAFRRSVSDPTPSSKSRKESFFFTKVLGKPAKESPVEEIMRWKKLRERLSDMEEWVNSIVEDDGRKDDNTLDSNVSEVIVPEHSADLMEGEDGDTFALNHQCFCGKKYQFCLSVRSI